jgi:hypothetical protein
VDTVAPSVTITSPVNNSITGDSHGLSYTVTDAGSHTEQCKVDSAAFAVCTSNLGPLATGPHTVTVKSTDAAGNAGTAVSAFNVMSISKVTPATTENLTLQGADDWSHWGRTSSLPWDHKASGTQVSNVSAVAGTTIQQATTGVAPSATWTDGTPVANQSTATATGITSSSAAVGRGFSFTVGGLSSTEPRVLRIAVGALNAQGSLELSWASSPGAAIYDTSVVSTSGSVVNSVYQLVVQAPQASDTLSVKFTQNTSPGSNSRVRLYSVTLSRVGASRDPAPASADLSTDSLDWTHWGGATVPTTPSLTPVGKSGQTLVSNATQESGGTLSQATSSANPVSTGFSWTGGDTIASGSNVRTGISNTGGSLGRGFSFTVPAASTASRTLKLYVSATNSSTTAAQPGKLELFWGTSAVPELVDVPPSFASGTVNYIYTIPFRHPTAGTTLKVKWSTNSNSTSHKVTLQSAALY